MVVAETAQLSGESDDEYAAFLRYAAQDWERSIRKLAAETGHGQSKLFHWSTKYHWTERVQRVDLEQHRGIFDRRKWRAEQRKIEKWGPDPRMWTRAGRHQLAVHVYQSWRRSGGRRFPNDEQTRVWFAGYSRYTRWAFKKGVLGKPRKASRHLSFEQWFLGSDTPKRTNEASPHYGW